MEYEDAIEFYSCPLCGTGTGNDIDNEIYGTPEHDCPVEKEMMKDNPMTRTKAEQIVRSACIAANSQIIEKKFGCEVLLKNTRRGMLYWHKFPSKKFWKNDDRNRWETENGWIDGTEMASLIMNDDVEIIGRPIRLADVLWMIWKMFECEDSMDRVYVDSGGMFYLEDMNESDVDGYEPEAGEVWNMQKDSLTEQSDDTKIWLAGLLDRKET